MALRIGSGFDIHRLKRGRRLLLGCLAIEWPRGPAGHSDGDPVAHALADALLGAAGIGDIGDLFPDTEPAWKDCPGERILGAVVERVRQAGFAVVNADVTIFLEKPTLGPRKPEIRQCLARILGVDAARVTVKAKTGEGFGAVGRGDCVAAQASVLLETLPGGPG
jgi:2-C-methyl-D-erythritol 2,4-cyclodiphosphate synthase